MNKSYIAVITAFIGFSLVACNKERSFQIEGEVEGASGRTLILEKPGFDGTWIAIDSTKIGDSGKFRISGAAPASPDIYRLSLGKSFVYIPVDSTETITLKSTADGFGSLFTLAGSNNAELMADFEKDLLNSQFSDSASISDFKRNVYMKYIKDGKGSIVSYYILTKFVGGKPLYDPTLPEDAKYYAAVATQFDNYRPDDPHGRMIKDVALKARRNHNASVGNKRVVEAEEIKVLDINLPNEEGRDTKLSDIVGRGKQVVVIFSLMNEPESPAFNRELNRIYSAKKGGVEFYQISFDQDQYQWREAAKNLPWITVIDPRGYSSTAIIDYNVTSLPAVFIYNSAGDLVSRPESLEAMEKLL